MNPRRNRQTIPEVQRFKSQKSCFALALYIMTLIEPFEFDEIIHHCVHLAGLLVPPGLNHTRVPLEIARSWVHLQ